MRFSIIFVTQFGSWNEEGNNHASKWLLIQALVNLKQTNNIYIYFKLIYNGQKCCLFVCFTNFFLLLFFLKFYGTFNVTALERSDFFFVIFCF